MMWFAAGLTGLVGVSLGLFGGGGSLLTLPILVYAAGVPVRQAIPLSLLVVGGTSAAALLMQGRIAQVRWRTGVLFGVGGMAGAYLGGRTAAFVPEVVLLVGFALIMIAAAVAMLRRSSGTARDTAYRPHDVRIGIALALGGGIGFMSGLAGAGGGFLIMPALVLVGGLEIRSAISTSLFVIAMQSLAGLSGHTLDLGPYWNLGMLSTGTAIAGSAAGSRLCAKLSQSRLRRAFAVFVGTVGIFMLVKQLPHSWFANVRLLSGFSAPLVGGAVIGLAAAMLWLLNGRIAGVSGIAGGLLRAARGDRLWRALFLLGLAAGGLLTSRIWSGAFEHATASLNTLVVGGLLVGFGTALSNGCTSGHGVCGVSRLSPRSLVAVGLFMGMGMFTVYLVRHLVAVVQ
jgi:uncharacterized membrane protein YfcA/uncharacterized membrane protein YedE/YeeE